MSLSLQQIFNNGYRGLKSQEFKLCVDAHGSCVYDDGKGHHCVIGWSLPAGSKLNKAFGGITALKEADSEDFNALFGDISWLTLISLQRIHDDKGYSPDTRRIELERFAKQHHLTVPED